MKKGYRAFVFLLGFFCVQVLFSQGYKIPETPKYQTSVYDYINLLPVDKKNSLERKLLNYSDSTSTQIVVAIINTTEGENIGYLATNWAHKWGIGRQEEDNGVFVLLAKDDKKITISTGYGVEHLLTDYISRQIIENRILPYFKQGDFYEGLNSGVEAVFEVLKGQYKAKKIKDKKGLNLSSIIVLIIFFVIFFIFVSNNRNNRGGGRRGGISSGDIISAIVLSSLGRGNFKSGDFDSGGFGGGGFGGGGFGGGGATGSW
ncbi:MAG: TPM domain-containing protein [Tenacibaculum sp.]